MTSIGKYPITLNGIDGMTCVETAVKMILAYREILSDYGDAAAELEPLSLFGLEFFSREFNYTLILPDLLRMGTDDWIARFRDVLLKQDTESLTAFEETFFAMLESSALPDLAAEVKAELIATRDNKII